MGAESGRAILGQFDGDRLDISELHRFPNTPVRLPDGLHWNVLSLWSEMKRSLALAAQKGLQPEGFGLDTWGVDFGLLDRRGSLLGNPFHYRDSRTNGMMDEAWKVVPRADIFNQTGIAFLQLNSLYQLLAMVRGDSPTLAIARTFLTMPDLFNYWMTGQKVCEYTIATTTQCYDTRRNVWANPLLERLGIPTQIFPDVVQPGTVLGPLVDEVAEEVGVKRLQVIAPASHDTGSAVAAVPASRPDFAWISSGTWSIMGVESPAPVINDQILNFNFTNEGGVNGTIRLSRNIMGLWLVQECRRTWISQGESLSYDELTQLAAQALPLRSIVDPDSDEFFAPGDMPSRIQAYCRRTGQPVPETKGAIVRCALESVALKYRWVLERLETLVGHSLGVIHIVGGGTQNKLLSQLTADATCRPVITGPIEATAIGNILSQMIGLKVLASLADAREVVRRSFNVLTFEPKDTAGWDAAFDRLQALVENPA
jgi:rhamnulokinase